MLRFLAAPAACLILCGAAAAQDMPGLATLAPPDLMQPSLVAPERGADAGRPDAGPAVPVGARAGQSPLGVRAARGDPGGKQALADLKSGPARPWCAQDRRVGTGAGFCLIN
ncbi:hypothetical protein MKK69_14640 [Methylobacterium sp. J-026]|uniref:hypothetical protein n=1 Tax=Methylobacterium sp. J-026 TaxID=2836624 RepID=UPI001FBA692A|nr:hypothetical protein [Methylobacterium sp. J-026]MCJ2135275.1 hypothetical protein [Methylobacterium sp. J-026]